MKKRKRKKRPVWTRAMLAEVERGAQDLYRYFMPVLSANDAWGHALSEQVILAWGREVKIREWDSGNPFRTVGRLAPDVTVERFWEEVYEAYGK